MAPPPFTPVDLRLQRTRPLWPERPKRRALLILVMAVLGALAAGL